MNMTQFESGLLADLREHVAQQDVQHLAARRTRRRRGALTGGIAAAAAGVIAAVTLQPSAAYAVETEDDGDVVVTIRELKDAEGLERALEAEGVDAEVSYVPMDAGLPIEEWPQGQPGPGGGQAEHLPDPPGSGPAHGQVDEPADTRADGPVACMSSIGMEFADGEVRFTVPKSLVDSEGTLRVVTSGTGEGAASLAVSWDGASC